MAFYEVVAYQRMQNAFAAPDFVELGRIVQVGSDEGGGLAWSRELYSDWSITIATSPTNLLPEIGDCLLNMRATPIELGIWRDGVLEMRGPLIAWQVEGNTVILNARGIGYYLRYMMLEADASYVTNPVAVMVDLINDAQALEDGNYGLVTTGTTASALSVTKAYLETDLINIGEECRILADGQFDFDFDFTTRELLTYPGAKGAVLPNVVFDQRSIVHPSMSMSVTAGLFGTMAKGSAVIPPATTPVFDDSTGHFSVRESFGRAWVAEAFSNIGSTDELGRKTAQLSQEAAANIFKPPKEFWSMPEIDVTQCAPGDTVTFVYDAGFGEITYEGRIKNQFVSVQEGGQDKQTIEFIEQPTGVPCE